MNMLLLFGHPVFQALGLTILHSLWQGFLIFCLLQILKAAIPQSNARLRYVFSYSALVFLFVMFAFTFITEWHTLYRFQNSMDPTLPTNASLGAPALPFLPENRAPNWQGFLIRYGSWPIQQSLPVLSLLYALGVCFYCGKMSLELLRLKPLRKNNQAPQAPLQETFRRLSNLTLPGKHIHLQISAKVNVPLMLGYFKPLILLPPALVNHLTLQQTEAILLHELAHLKRKDYLFNIIQTVLETFLFFNPATWLLSAAIRNEREHCCDDFVLAHTSQPMPYAQALLTLETQRQATWASALSATGPSGASLFNRIKRIVDMTHSQKKPQRTLATLSVLVLVATMACFFTAFSQSQKEEEPVIHPAYASSDPVNPPDIGSDDNPLQEQLAKPKPAISKADEDHTDADDLSQQTLQQAKLALEITKTQISQIPWDSISNVISLSLSSINWDSISNVVDQSLSAIDQKQVSAQMIQERNRNREELVQNKEQMKEQLQEAREQMKQAMEKAKAEIDAARKEIDAARKEVEEARQNRIPAIQVNRQQIQQNFSDSIRSVRRMRLNEMQQMRQQIDSIRNWMPTLTSHSREAAAPDLKRRV